jgi:hypothetical protein
VSDAAVERKYDLRVRTRHFAVCVRNRGYRASLELRKLYAVVPDAFADEHQMIRVIDGSGEDYLYPEKFFVRMDRLRRRHVG